MEGLQEYNGRYTVYEKKFYKYLDEKSKSMELLAIDNDAWNGNKKSLIAYKQPEDSFKHRNDMKTWNGLVKRNYIVEKG